MRLVAVAFLISLAFPAPSRAVPVLASFDTGKPVLSIAPIPARGHRGETRLAVAHGDAGAAIYSPTGRLLWEDPRPAHIVAFYDNSLMIYRSEGGTSRLERYRYLSPSAITPIASDSPSPIAATTLLRTASATLGPTQIIENGIEVDGTSRRLDRPVSAIAGSKIFVPLSPVKTVIVGTDKGEILLYRADDLLTAGP